MAERIRRVESEVSKDEAKPEFGEKEVIREIGKHLDEQDKVVDGYPVEIRGEFRCLIERAREQLRDKTFGPDLEILLKRDFKKEAERKGLKDELSDWLNLEPNKVINESTKKKIEEEILPGLDEEIEGYGEERAKLMNGLKKIEKERTEE